MTGLVAAADDQDPEEGAVAADGWFPDIALATIRNSVRLVDGAVTTDRLTGAIEGAMLTAFRALAPWRAAQILAGAATFDQVTALELNGRNRAEALWERIIRHFAAAELADLNRDLTATDEGLDRADEASESADEHRRLAYAALADMQSIGGGLVPRNRVSLV